MPRRDEGLGKGVEQCCIWAYVGDQRQWAGEASQGAAYRFALNWKEEHVLGHLAGRALPTIGIGRQNWQFTVADTGAESLARTMIIIETAKPNGLGPQRLADIHAHKINQLNELLP